jgi:UDP-glucuronate decarboxylase
MDTGHEVTGPINLGNPTEFTMSQLAEKVLRMVGGSSELVFRPLPQDDPTQRQPVIEQARNALGWTPLVDLEEGLSRTIEYFQQHLKVLSAE